jgi:2-polyprenyl-3-methyl-5-hydroxy-6-metoxy-1,4-benzoquinol methylase
VRQRQRIPELMDDPALDPAEHRAALAGLARINRLSRSDAILWPVVKELAARNPNRAVRLLDVATGSGDVPLALLKRARAAGVALDVRACDISPTAVAATPPEVNAFAHDVLRDPLPDGFDVATCSLFLHHLSDDDGVTLLARLAAAAPVVLVNDLARSRLGFAAAWVGCRLLTRSRVVRFDGPASVRSAFTPAEAIALAGRAGLRGATAARRWPFRFLLKWEKS